MKTRSTLQGQSQVKVLPVNGREKSTTPNVESGVRYVSLKDGAERIGLSFWTLREYVCAGLIPSVRLPHPFKSGKFLARILVDVRDLDSFMEQHKSEANTKHGVFNDA